jgi:hypothetical protein
MLLVLRRALSFLRRVGPPVVFICSLGVGSIAVVVVWVLAVFGDHPFFDHFFGAAFVYGLILLAYTYFVRREKHTAALAFGLYGVAILGTLIATRYIVGMIPWFTVGDRSLWLVALVGPMFFLPTLWGSWKLRRFTAHWDSRRTPEEESDLTGDEMLPKMTSRVTERFSGSLGFLTSLGLEVPVLPSNFFEYGSWLDEVEKRIKLARRLRSGEVGLRVLSQLRLMYQEALGICNAYSEIARAGQDHELKEQEIRTRMKQLELEYVKADLEIQRLRREAETESEPKVDWSDPKQAGEDLRRRCRDTINPLAEVSRVEEEEIQSNPQFAPVIRDAAERLRREILSGRWPPHHGTT